MKNFRHVKGMELLLSIGVPSIQQLMLHFEGLARVSKRQFEKGYLLVVEKLFLAR